MANGAKAKSITTAIKLAAVRRELAARRRAYPVMVKKGSMSFEAAKHELAVMAAIEEDYQARWVDEEPVTA